MKETERIYFFSIQKNNEIILELFIRSGQKVSLWIGNVAE